MKMSGDSVALNLESSSSFNDLGDVIMETFKWKAITFLMDDRTVINPQHALSDYRSTTVRSEDDEDAVFNEAQKHPLVGKVLKVMEEGKLNTAALVVANAVGPQWSLNDEPEVDFSEVDRLISKVLCSCSSDDICKIHFIRVLGHLLMKARSWSFVFLPHEAYNCYAFLISVAKVAATMPVTLNSPQLVIGLQLREDGRVHLAEVGPLSMENADGNGVDISPSLLKLFCMNTVGPQPQTRINVAETLLALAGVISDSWGGYSQGRDHPPVDHTVELSTTSYLALINVHLRLLSDVCPVQTIGILSLGMANVLAGSLDLTLQVLRAEDCKGFFQIDADNLDAPNEKKEMRTKPSTQSLRSHVDQSLRKASIAGKTGAMLIIVGITDIIQSSLGHVCRRLKADASPAILHFIFCVTESIGQTLNTRRVSQS